ncbi:MAG: DNA topoisomerase 4 subunit A, partial [Planctomycetota bacterium]
MPPAETIEAIDLSEAARVRYLRYAMSVITSRALPDVRDGLKPVQRRILYAMEHDLHLRADRKPVKSAKVVGQVMSNYHPHGDAAIYDAMVRMAQPFSLRYPLVEGQGNFGAITGDAAAAFRYTEARLRPLGSELMTLLGEETVATRPNYDETTREPEVLPTPLPLLLLNGSTGIAVGMSTNVPPHNLAEVARATAALIDDPQCSVARLLRSIKGPDFPTGGELLATRAELRKIYETGGGTVKLQGTWKLETPQRTARQRVARRYLVITSVPYGVTTTQIVAKIRELVEGKKLPQVAQVSDQTDKDGVRIVLELKTDTQVEPEVIMAAIYKKTPLRINYSINLTCLMPGKGAFPVPRKHVPLGEILRAWLDFRFEVVTRSLEFRKRKLEERIHILEGLAKVLRAVDEAIKLVRGSKDKADARARLQKRFKLSDAQADAVLEIQLYRLARLEVKKIRDELAEKSRERDRIARLLKGTKPRWNLIKKELGELAKAYGKDARRTRIVSDDLVEEEFDATALIRDEDAHVVLTEQGRVKRQRSLESLDKVRVREGDAVRHVLRGSTREHVVFFSNYGTAYVIRINDLPATSGFGEPIQKYFNFKDGERIVAALSLDPRVLPPREGETLLVGVSSGHVLRVPLAPHREPSTRSGRRFVRCGAGHEVVSVEPTPARGKHVLLLTSKGRGLRLSLAEVPAVSGVGKGKKLLRLAKGERLVVATTAQDVEVETARSSTRRVVA